MAPVLNRARKLVTCFAMANMDLTARMSRVLGALVSTGTNSWVLGDRLQLSLRRASSTTALCSWGDGQGLWFALSDSQAPDLEDPTVEEHRTLLPLYVAGQHAVWDLGSAFLKIVEPSSPSATRENVTLADIRSRNPSFKIPEVLSHGELGRTILSAGE